MQIPKIKTALTAESSERRSVLVLFVPFVAALLPSLISLRGVAPFLPWSLARVAMVGEGTRPPYSFNLPDSRLPYS